MSAHTGILPVRAAAERTRAVKQRIFKSCYLAAISVATVGWLFALGWATVEVAELLLL